MTASRRQRDQSFGALEPPAPGDALCSRRLTHALKPAGVVMGDRGEAGFVPGIEGQPFTLLRIRALFRDRLGETERAGERDCDRAVAVGEFFEQKRVHDGGLFQRGRARLGGGLHQAETPGRSQNGLRKSRRLVGAARGGREFGPREFGDRGARNLLFLG
jgi:hypothetical protein